MGTENLGAPPIDAGTAIWIGLSLGIAGGIALSDYYYAPRYYGSGGDAEYTP